MKFNTRMFYFINYFGKAEPPWHTSKPIEGELKAHVEGELKLPPGRALDVGCGSARNSVYLAEHGWEVTGIDVVGKALRMAKKRLAAATPEVSARVRLIKDDGKRLTKLAAEAPFDLVLDVFAAAGDLEPKEVPAYAAQVATVMAPTGRFLVYVWTEHAADFMPGFAAHFELERQSQSMDLKGINGYWYVLRKKGAAAR